MKNHLKWISFLLVFIVIGLAGCSSNTSKDSKGERQATSVKTQKQVLSGVYKETDDDATRDDGSEQPTYIYFSKDGKLLMAEPETGDDDSGYYGSAYRGTWKNVGNNKFLLKVHSVYDKNYYTLKLKKVNNSISFESTDDNATYTWDEDHYTKIDMIYNDFMDMFNKAKESEQEGIKEDGYTEPDNDGSDDSSTSDSDSDNTKTVGVLILADAQGGLDKIEDTDVEYIIMPKDNTYEIGLGTKDSTLEYTIDGDKVTFTDGGLDYSESSRKTLSINDLKKKYYSSSDDKSTVDDIASDANVTDMSNE